MYTKRNTIYLFASHREATYFDYTMMLLANDACEHKSIHERLICDAAMNTVETKLLQITTVA